MIQHVKVPTRIYELEFPIYIKTLTGKTLRIMASYENTIEKVKEKV